MKPLGVASLVAGSTMLVFVAHVACSSYADNCHNTNTCDPGDDDDTIGDDDTSDDDDTGGTGGAFGTGGGSLANSPPGSCDKTKTPYEDACVIQDAWAIFVSPNGDDSSGIGSKNKPLKTLAAALGRATADNKPRVFLCGDAGPFEEDVVIGTNVDGVQIYGGFTCDGFAYRLGARTKIISNSSTAWKVTGVMKGLHLEDLEITGADAAGEGESAFGMVITNSYNVLLKRVSVQAGAGGKGADGASGTPGEPGQQTLGPVQHGQAATCDRSTVVGGRWADDLPCGSRGGNGGSSDGQSGSPGLPGGTDNSGAGSTSGAGQPGGTGATGATGTPGAAAKEAGVLTINGYTPRGGSPGSTGSVGQGGGGGGASTGAGSCAGASGGAGGKAGCGGGGGGGGSGGGASVGLLMSASSVQLENTVISAGRGGAGGKGGDGGPGGAGGPGGRGGDAAAGQPAGGAGGPGGTGGYGGPGSGGLGGPSYAVAFSGDPPVLGAEVGLTSGIGGDAGPGGVSGTTRGPAGVAGPSAKQYPIP